MNSLYPRLGLTGVDTSKASFIGQFDVYCPWLDYGNDYGAIKAVNPNILIVPVKTVQTNADGGGFPDGGPSTNMPPAFLLRDSLGNVLPYPQPPPIGPMCNYSDLCPVVNGQQWTDWLLAWTARNTWNVGYGDGVIWDDWGDTLDWLSGGDIDLDNDGINDLTNPSQGRAWVIQHLAAGLQSLADAARTSLGSSRVQMYNPGGGDNLARNSTNGIQNQGWNGAKEGGEGWLGGFNDYLAWETNHYGTEYYLVQGSYNNPFVAESGYQTNYAAMRYYLTTCLLGSGYFEWDDQGVSPIWYDEFSVTLATGQATGDASAKGYLGQPLGTYQLLANGVYRRDYTNGIALCNPTGTAQTVDLGGTYRKISGTQDPTVNNGQTVTSVTIGAGTGGGSVGYGDGVILLR